MKKNNFKNIILILLTFVLGCDRYIKGENLIYVCVNNTCKFPVNNVEEALNLITQNDEKK